jgi:hypothetical protein
MKYLLFGASLLIACILTRRYATSWWVCVVAASGFYLAAMVILSPVLMVFMLKEIAVLTYRGLKE